MLADIVNCNVLTLGSLLRVLRGLARLRCSTQEGWFALLWRSYHKKRGDEYGTIYLTAQATVSKILGDRIMMPRSMYIHYTTQPELLRRDMEDYISDVTSTARQRQLHINTLRQMVRNASNLVPGDKDYILDYTTVAESDQLEELLYRMIYILIHEPGSNTMAA